MKIVRHQSYKITPNDTPCSASYVTVFVKGVKGFEESYDTESVPRKKGLSDLKVKKERVYE